jgi:hypothetical protein
MLVPKLSFEASFSIGDFCRCTLVSHGKLFHPFHHWIRNIILHVSSQLMYLTLVPYT